MQFRKLILPKTHPPKTAINFKGAPLSELTMHMQQQHYCQCKKGGGRYGTTSSLDFNQFELCSKALSLSWNDPWHSPSVVPRSAALAKWRRRSCTAQAKNRKEYLQLVLSLERFWWQILGTEYFWTQGFALRREESKVCLLRMNLRWLPKYLGAKAVKRCLIFK